MESQRHHSEISPYVAPNIAILLFIQSFITPQFPFRQSWRRTGKRLLNYQEDAPSRLKEALIRRMDRLSETDWQDTENKLSEIITDDYNAFIEELELAILRELVSIRILGLFGEEITLETTEEAIIELESYYCDDGKNFEFNMFELDVRFSNSSRIEGIFTGKEEAIDFLKMLEQRHPRACPC